MRAAFEQALLPDGEPFEPGEIVGELTDIVRECGLFDEETADGPASSREPDGSGRTETGNPVARGKNTAPRHGRKQGRNRGRGIRPTVIVTVPVFTLMGLSEEPATLDGYGPIDAETARELCANASSFLRLMVHPETGVPLSLGREHYAVPADLRIWLNTRDGTCRGVNCGQPAATSEIDHTIAYAHGGRTDDLNLACLCKACHRLKHASTWHPLALGNGVIEWTSPTGRVYTTRPALELPGTSLPNVSRINEINIDDINSDDISSDEMNSDEMNSDFDVDPSAVGQAPAASGSEPEPPPLSHTEAPPF
jgi:hypothetical protein